MVIGAEQCINLVRSGPAVIVLAAGRASRFRASGGNQNKLGADLLGVPVLEHVLRAVRSSGLPWYVVREAPGGGMGDSIAAGVRALPDAAGWLVLPGDLPLVTASVILLVAEALEQKTVVVPTFSERRGHPVGFASECRCALESLSGDKGAAEIVRGYQEAGQVLELALEEPSILMDVDTMDDLAQIAELLAHRRARTQLRHG